MINIENKQKKPLKWFYSHFSNVQLLLKNDKYHIHLWPTMSNTFKCTISCTDILMLNIFKLVKQIIFFSIMMDTDVKSYIFCPLDNVLETQEK